MIAVDGFWFGDDEQSGLEEPAADDLFGQHYTAVTKAALPAMSMRDPDPLAEMFRAAGFDPVSIDHLAEVHALAADPPGDEPWYVIIAGRP